MTLKKLQLTKKNIFISISFFVLFLNFSVNLFRVVSSESFHNFDLYSESLVYGRLARTDIEGIFSHGGLPGENYVKGEVEEGADVINHAYMNQLNYYLNEKETPPDYYVYKSRTSGEGFVYGLIQEISPLDNRSNFRIFKLINAFLVALVFTLFIGWVYRNYGLVTGAISLLLIIFSPWIVCFSHSLWWSLWTYYLPFLTMLLLLEKKHKEPDFISYNKVLLYLFIAVFAKIFFTGFEFVTTTLLAIVCPVIFYFFAEKKPFKSFFIFSLKTGVIAVAAILAELLVLLTQFKFMAGSFMAGIDHIIFSYTRRTDTSDISSDFSLMGLIGAYFKGNVLDYEFLIPGVWMWFGHLLLIMAIAGVIVYFLSRKLADRKNKALLLTAFGSILCPLSWVIIFKEHSYIHFHLDYIIWYIPTLLLGFVVIGQAVSLSVEKIKR